MEKNFYFSTCPTPTLIHFSHRLTSASKPAAEKFLTVVSVTSAPPFPHFRLSNVLERIYRTNCDSLYTTDTSHLKQETFLYENHFH
jgi:hypothetical protein